MVRIAELMRRLARTNDAAFSVALFLHGIKRRPSRRDTTLPITWLDEADATEKGILRRGRDSVSHGPMRAQSNEQRLENVRLPDLHYRRFNNARISAASSSIVLEEARVLIERVPGSDGREFDYCGGHLRMHGHRRAAVKMREPDRLARGIFVAGNGSFNYYHWLVELFPKLELLSGLPEPYRDWPLLMSEDAREISSFDESIQLSGVSADVIYLDRKRSYLVDELVYLDTPNNMPFNLTVGTRFRASSFFTDRESVDFVRRTLLGEASAGKTAARRIFLGRRNERRPYNEKQVASCLDQFGFETVYMEELSLQEQARTVSEAEWIVGPTGAAWTNLIFASSGARCLCWMPEEYGDFSSFSNIAAIVGAQLHYLTYRTGARTTAELYQSSYSVDVTEIERFLKEPGGARLTRDPWPSNLDSRSGAP